MMKLRTPKQLPRSFYDRSPEVVARDLLAKVLVHRYEGQRLSGRITEVEAYLGFADAASHASVGRTARNAVLFGPPGVSYVYFIYGMHYCLNVSCLPDGEPGGVLFRAMFPMDGVETMERLRGLEAGASSQQIAGGPGKMCEALGISREASNGIDVTLPRSDIRIYDDGFKVDVIEVTPRIGIRKAAEMPLRFLLGAEAMKLLLPSPRKGSRR